MGWPVIGEVSFSSVLEKITTGHNRITNENEVNVNTGVDASMQRN